ncbi:sulfotransferase domain-containing protein [bacterium]|nr:sulfotransferase domain-containing protein [bacterium]
MPKPNFLVIGSQKCGTTWLANVLSRHPEVYSPPNQKELHFFDDRPTFEKGMDWFLSQFEDGSGKKRIGEYTPNTIYLGRGPEDDPTWREETPERVRELDPQMKLIVLLREPVSRAVSAHYHNMGVGRIAPTMDIFDADRSFHTIRMGLYAFQLKRWFEVFPREQFLILFFEEAVRTDQHSTLQTTLDFLDLSPFPQGMMPDLQKAHNKRASFLAMRLRRGYPRLSWAVDRFLPSAIKNQSRFRISLPKDRLAEMRAFYKEPDAELADLLGRQLPWAGGR